MPGSRRAAPAWPPSPGPPWPRRCWPPHPGGGDAEQPGGATLVGRAVLPAATFAGGPVSGQYIGPGPIGGQQVPFAHQPVQGFSALLPVRGARGDYWALMDNGYGSEENSADSLLRIYRIRPHLSSPRSTGGVTVVSHVDLADPDHRVPWTIVGFFTRQRLLTGADFDPESLQQAPDGTFWIGDEFGPFVMHFSRTGRLLETPIPQPGLRSPQSPDLEEAQGVRVMDALRQHAQRFGGATPVVSPDANLLVDHDPATNIASRVDPPAGSGVPAASSEILTVATLHTAGFTVVPYTVDDPARMDALLKLGVDGLISDNSDLEYQRVAAFDANGDGTPGDYLLPDGRIDPAKFFAQGHRGSRGLRPENTLPAFEAGLDNLMNTMETDTGITRDRVPVISHDPFLDPTKCRNADGSPLGGDILIRDLTARQIQHDYVCDELLPTFPEQSNDLALSPVAVAYARAHHIAAYAKPRLQDLFDFADFYARWFSTGPGRSDPGAAVKARNARTVHFNVETKINPVPQFASRTVSAEAFERIDDGLVARNHLESRVTLQSFDWRTLLLAQQKHPKIATVALWGDSPIFADPAIPGSGDGGNLQPVGGNTPWLGGLVWPWRQTLQTLPAKVQASGGYEAMAISPDGRTLYPALEKPLAGSTEGTARIAEFDLRSRSFTPSDLGVPVRPDRDQPAGPAAVRAGPRRRDRAGQLHRHPHRSQGGVRGDPAAGRRHRDQDAGGRPAAHRRPGRHRPAGPVRAAGRPGRRAGPAGDAVRDHRGGGGQGPADAGDRQRQQRPVLDRPARRHPAHRRQRRDRDPAGPAAAAVTPPGVRADRRRTPGDPAGC